MSAGGLDLGYIAGVLDARGYLDVPRSRVAVTTRRVTLLQWLADRTGVSVTTDTRPYKRRACGEHCADPHQHVARQSAYWTVRGMRATIILDACLPYLVQTRGDALAIIRAETLGESRPRHLERTETGAAMSRLGWPLPSLTTI